MVRSAGDLLKSFLGNGQFEKAATVDSFYRSWKEITGDERLATHSRIFDIVNGIAIVQVDHPGWMQMLQFRQTAILGAIERRFPQLGVRGIAFRLASFDTAPADIPEQVSHVSANAPVPEELATDLEKIEDPRLREVLGRLAESIARKNG